MTDTTTEVALRVLERFGVPTALMAVMLYFCHSAAVSLSVHVLQPVVKAHMAFLESTSQTQESIGDSLSRQATTLSEIAKTQQDIYQAVVRPRGAGSQ